MAKRETARERQARVRRQARAAKAKTSKNIAPGTGRSKASRSRSVPSLMTPGTTYGNPGSSTKKETPQQRQRRLRGRSQTPKRTASTRSRAENRRSSSSSSRTIPASKRPADMRKGVTYGDAGRPYKGPGGNPNGSGQGQAQQAPPAPKLPPRKKPAPKAAAPKATAPKTPAKKAPAPKAAAPKTPAKRKPRSWVKDNYKPGAKGIKSSRLSKALTNLKVRDYKKKKK